MNRRTFPGMSRPLTKSEGPKLGRNDRCHCGSGLKFKRCHGTNEEERKANLARAIATSAEQIRYDLRRGSK